MRGIHVVVGAQLGIVDGASRRDDFALLFFLRGLVFCQFCRVKRVSVLFHFRVLVGGGGVYNPFLHKRIGGHIQSRPCAEEFKVLVKSGPEARIFKRIFAQYGELLGFH